MSSEADDTETMVDFGLGVGASPGVGKRGRRSFPFVGRRKDKGEESMKEFGLFGDRRARRRAQSLGYVVEGGMGAKSPRVGSPLSTAQEGQVLRESEGETSGREERTTEKEVRRRSGLTFQDFKAAFGKRERERRGSAGHGPGQGAYTLSSSTASPSADGEAAARVPRAAASSALGLGRPSSANAQVSPRSASDGSARRQSMPLRLDTNLDLGDRAEVQSPFTRAPSPPQQPSLFNGEVVIRVESGRRRTRSSAIPGLYTDAEVVRRW